MNESSEKSLNPQVSAHRRMLTIASLILAAIFAVLILLASPTKAFAVNRYVGDIPETVPACDISWRGATSTEFKNYGNFFQEGRLWFDSGWIVVGVHDVEPGYDWRSVPGYFQIIYRNGAYDKDGDLCDVTYTISNVCTRKLNYYEDVLNDPSNPSYPIGSTYSFMAFHWGSPYLRGSGAMPTLTSGPYPSPTQTQYDIEVRITKHDSGMPATGRFIGVVSDHDDGIGTQDDTTFFQFLSGLAGIYTDPKCECLFRDGNTVIYPPDSGEDFNASSIKNNTYTYLGFAYNADSTFKVRYRGRGSNSWAIIGDSFGQYSISTSITGGHGQITPSIVTGFKTSRTFNWDTSDFSIIKHVYIDGVEKPSSIKTWTFSNIRESHSIRVVLAERFPLIYDLGGGTSDTIIQSIEDAQADGGKGYIEVDTDCVLSLDTPYREGYTFLGWSETPVADATNKSMYDDACSHKVESVLIPHETKTVYAMWAKNPTITYTDRGKTVKTETVPPGSSPNPPQLPARDGYTFKLFSPYEPQVYKDVTCEAVWEANVYQIVLKPNEGDGSQDPMWSETDAPIVVPEPEITREGYLFDHWTDEEGTIRHPGETVYNLPTLGEAQRTLTAEWKPIGYQIIYDANEGEGYMENTACTYDIATELSSCTFTMLGHTFQGWSTEPSGPVVYESNAVVLNLSNQDQDTIVLYAIWNEDTDVRITYRAEDPTHTSLNFEHEDIAPATGEARGCTAAPARGYVFVCWKSPSGDELADTALVVPTRGEDGLWHAQELIACIRPAKYQVCFDAAGGDNAPTALECEYDHQSVLPMNAPSWGTRAFLGWAETPSGPAVYQPGVPIENLTEEDSATVTLYAVWGPEIFTVTYTDGNGNVLKTEEVEVGKPSTPPSVPECYGFDFAGWSEPTDNVTRNMVVDATWKQVFHTVRFMDGAGREIALIEVAHGMSADIPTDPEKDGLSFIGWDNDTSCVEQDMIVQALWEVNQVESSSGVGAFGSLPQTGDSLTALLASLALIILGAFSCAITARLRRRQ